MNKKLALPTPEQVAWHDMEIGMFIHWGSFVYKHDPDKTKPVPLDVINPEGFDADAWVQCAVDMDAKYIVMVVRHCDGFCLWQTDASPYGVKHIRWKDGKGDMVEEISQACRRRGIRLGVYLSPADRILGARVGGVCDTPEDQRRYDTLYRQQLTELLTRYGEMVEVWFDGNTHCEIGDIFERYAPHIMIFHSKHANIRWVGNEDGIARYPAWNSVVGGRDLSCATIVDSDPDGDVWMPLECDTTIRRGWGWKKENDDTTKSLEHLMKTYYHTVGNGAVLLLNSNPDDRGVMPAGDATRHKEFGDAIRQLYASRVAVTAGEGDVLELDLDGLKAVDHIIMMEDIRYGERVRRYKVEGWDGSGWKTLAAGTAIGHKRIHPLHETRVEKLRFTALRYADTPMMKDFSVYLARFPFDPPVLENEEAEAVTILQWGKDIFYGNGRLKGQPLPINLTSLLIDETDVGQYEISLHGENGQPVITEAVLEMDGVSKPDHIEILSADTLRITIPGVNMKTVLRIMTDMPSTDSAGVVRMKKL